MNDQETLDSFQAQVVGRVQGVGFRWFVQQEAVRRGLTGTVRNMRDGSVEVWAEGEQGTLVELAGAVARGPTHGRVDQLMINWNTATGRWDDFTIIT
jgi:acylphosphatase